ncbi:MAG TPA: glycosyltransferase family 39 protein [Thermoanaerobaculia bacterium]|jgi:hypothetical protein|nr:glycosyltransferase family 39 protein [Thermoanaerobaculia bacterium]
MRRAQQIGFAALLAAIVAVAFFLRFDGLGEPSYWLDEILGQIVLTNAAELPFWQWLGGVHPQHGPLYYATLGLGRLLGESEFAGRFFAAIFGVLTVPLMWIAARRITNDSSTAAVAALLLAVSPLHVYYSREARPYALLVFLMTALLLAIVLRATRLAIALLVLMAYTTVGAAAAIVAAACAALPRRQWVIAISSVLTLGLLPILYRAGNGDGAAAAAFPQLDLAFFDTLIRGLSVTALGGVAAGRSAYVILAFAIVGAIALFLHDRAMAAIVLAITLLPIVINIVALHATDHFFAIRYVIAALPGYLLLAAAGIAFLARFAARRFALPASIVIAAVLAVQVWPAARTEAYQKLDWRAIAESLRRHVRADDVILTAEHWSEVSLRYYLGEIPNVTFAYMAGVGIAEIIQSQHRSAWLVTAGSSNDLSVRTWMCRYPVVLSSPLEDFRLHYAPSRGHFLQHRSQPPEQRAVSAALGDRGFTIRMEDDVLFGSGWAGVEHSGDETFRWAIGRRASVVLPTRERRERTIRFHAYPHLPQTMRVSLNDHEIAAIPLAREWRDYSVVAPAAVWNDGLNTLTFHFEIAAAPSPTDRRKLAASFESISLDDESRPARVPSIRIDADTFLDANSAWRNTITHFPPAHLRRETIEPLLGRLGFDPATGWQKLTRGEVRLENLAETIAYGSDCEDDRTFLRRAFAILVERAPNELEERDLLRRMREGTSRVRIMGRIVKVDDFRRTHSTIK